LFLSAGIDFSWEAKGKVLYVCVVIYKSSMVAKKLYNYLSRHIRERRLHFRRLTRKKKKRLLSEVKRVIDGATLLSVRDILVFRLAIKEKSKAPKKYEWLERKIVEWLLLAKKYRNYPNIVIIGSDLEKGRYSFSERLSRMLKNKIEVYVDDKAYEVAVADVIVNYARLTKNLEAKKHYC